MKLSKKFEKTLDILSRCYDRTLVFHDLMKMCAISIYNVFAKDEQLEREYINTINRYQKEHQNLFPELFAEIVITLDENFRKGDITDILGPYYSLNSLCNSKLAQCFTPAHVSDFMGKIALQEQDAKSIIEKKGFITMNEPTCGSGRYGIVICESSI